MYKSIETRWFFGDEMTPLRKWFGENGEVFKDEWVRSDYYLDLDGSRNLSFKIREGKTEIKLLYESLGDMAFTDSVKGLVQKWVKWSPALKEGLNKPEHVFVEPEVFIEVKKERLLLAFEVLDNNRVRKAGKEENINEGCQVELTRIEVANKLYYSFCLEASGAEEKLYNNFKLVSGKVFDQLAQLVLAADQSYGFPVFLGKLKI